MSIIVSVIIPNYNHAKFLEERIQTILDQSYQYYELILLDDCSTDDSVEILRKFEQNDKVSKIILNDKNSGSTFKQWEKGIKYATGKYIWIAESDDYCDDNFLQTIVPLLEENENASFAYCQSFIHNMQSESIQNLSFWYKDLHRNRWDSDYTNSGYNELKKYVSYKNTIPNASAVLFRKDKFENIGNEYLNFKLSGDWMFWIQLLEQGDIVYTTKTSNYFRIHERSVRVKESKNNTSLIEREQICDYLLQKNIITKKKKKQLLENVHQQFYNKSTIFREFISLIRRRIAKYSLR